jgi:transposase-like protein
LERLLNELMKRERQRYLKQHPKEKANGFYRRSLRLTIGETEALGSPGPLRPHLPPLHPPAPWKRADRDYEELLIAMLSNGYSRAQMERALRSLGLPFSQEALEDALGLIQEKLSFYKTQPLKADWFTIFIDGYCAKLRGGEGKLEEITLFVAVGIDLEGNKEILGFWFWRGKESKAFWAEVFQDLVKRGVKRVLVFVTDDFRGIGDVVAKLFPFADHQLCLLHLQRNLKRKLSREAARLLRGIKEAKDREEGEELFSALCRVVEGENAKWAKGLSAKAEKYLAFLEYPQEVRKHIYTTNPVESVNGGIELMRLELGGYFPSQRALEVNLFIQVVNLQDRWWRRPVPGVRAKSYELLQIFAMRYELAEDAEPIHL